jgi:co-chaperonin GroES (HSP10)
MREDTRRKLNQALWRERLRYVAIGLAILAAIGAIMAYQSYDLAYTDSAVQGTVVEIDPLVSKTNAADGENVEVKLDTGQLVRVIAYKSRQLKAGDKVEITARHHGTGRMTYMLASQFNVHGTVVSAGPGSNGNGTDVEVKLDSGQTIHLNAASSRQLKAGEGLDLIAQSDRGGLFSYSLK